MKEATKESTMFNLVERWHKSGKSQKQFSSENNISFYAFNYWVQRYKRTKNTNPGFAAVTLTQEPEPGYSSAKIEIELAGGIIVRIY